MGKISSVLTEVNLFITIRQANKKVTAVHCNRTEIRGRNKILQENREKSNKFLVEWLGRDSQTWILKGE